VNAKTELDNIKSSRSWRYTAPCRYIYDAIINLSRKTKQVKKYNSSFLLQLSSLSILHSNIDRNLKISKILNIISEIETPTAIDKSPKVSIIIPCYNQIEYTAATIHAILTSKANISYEIILADDFSLRDDYKLLDRKKKFIRTIRVSENKGFIRNCNHAALNAWGQYLVFLNNDCFPQPGWLDSLVQTIELNTQIGIVGSKLINPDGSLQEAGGIIWRDATGWNYGRGQNPLSPEYNYKKEVDYCTGASFCIKKSLWEEVGGFNESFAPAYYEETDLSFRLREKGYKTVYQPKSIAIHLEGISNGTDIAQGLKKHQVINRMKFLQTWHEVLERDHFVNGSHERFARDRSMDKKHMLFVDHYLPETDRDAGSKQTLAYLKLFQKNNYQITFWSDNQSYNPIYASELENLGVEVINDRAGWIDFSGWIQANGKYLNVAFLSRPHIAVKYFNEIRRYSICRVIYYGHDIHVKRMNLQNALVPGSFTQATVEDVRGMEESCWDQSDVIFYPSIEEVEHLRGKYPHRIIDVLPIECWTDDEIKKSITPSAYGERKGLLFVGGFAHLPNRDAVHWFLNEVYPLIQMDSSNLEITIAGNAPPDEIKSRECDQVVVTGRVSEEELRALYNRAKVIVAPLRVGAGVKGKVVESLRMGVPVVTTSIGIQGLPGYENAIAVADDPADFAKAVLDLLRDESLWRSRREAGLKYYRENFAESVVAPKVLALLEGVS
jgi:O-antigen biosynthesis protein